MPAITREELEAPEGSGIIGFIGQGSDAVARTVQDKLRESVSLKDFGPCGLGDPTQDRAAFAKACDYLMEARRAVDVDPATFGSDLYPTTLIFIPPGDYELEGGLGCGLACLGFWAFPRTVTIRITDNSFLFEIPDYLHFTLFSGIDVIGGKGAIRHSYTGNNVAQFHIVEHCTFIDYTVCAISSDAGNMPYWRIRENQFFCLADSGTVAKGVAIGGLLDNSRIELNSFNRNDIHLQLGPILSGNFEVIGNDFLSFEADRTDYDIWLIPNDEQAFGTNAGQAGRFMGNKFGNEGISNLAKKAPRMLTAAATGTDRATCAPDLTWKNAANGTNWLKGLVFAENYITTANIKDNEDKDTGGADASFWRIYIENMDQIVYRDNLHAGGAFNYLFEHVDGGARRAHKDNTSWNVRLMTERNGPTPARYGISNRPIGILRDANGFASGPYAELPIPDPGAATILAVDAYTDWTLETGTTIAGGPDRGGGSTASSLTFPNGSNGVYVSLGNISAHAGKIGWMSLDLGTPASNRTGRLQVIVTVSNGSLVTWQLDEVVVTPSSGFDPLVVSWIFPGDALYCGIHIRAPDAATGANKTVLGNAAFGAGRTPPSIPPV